MANSAHILRVSPAKAKQSEILSTHFNSHNGHICLDHVSNLSVPFVFKKFPNVSVEGAKILCSVLQPKKTLTFLMVKTLGSKNTCPDILEEFLLSHCKLLWQYLLAISNLKEIHYPI